MRKYKFRVIVEQDEDGVYIAECPSLKGCYSQGDSIERRGIRKYKRCNPSTY